jgi:hypothetical protein
MSTIQNCILIALVMFGMFAGGYFIGQNRAIPTTQKSVEALQDSISVLHERLDFERKAFELSIDENVKYQMKYMYIDSLDTNGVSCTQVVEYQQKKYETRLEEYSLHWNWLRDKIDKMKKMEHFTYAYYKATKDTAAYNFLMEIRDPCDKRDGKVIPKE